MGNWSHGKTLFEEWPIDNIATLHHHKVTINDYVSDFYITRGEGRGVTKDYWTRNGWDRLCTEGHFKSAQEALESYWNANS